jgi:hypothetical protein
MPSATWVAIGSQRPATGPYFRPPIALSATGKSVSILMGSSGRGLEHSLDAWREATSADAGAVHDLASQVFGSVTIEAG